MITVYLQKHNTDSDEVLERTKEMVLACEVTYPEEETPHEQSFPCDALPCLRDDDRIVCGKEDVLNYLERLGGFLEEWQKFQSDTCYCDENGNIE